MLHVLIVLVDNLSNIDWLTVIYYVSGHLVLLCNLLLVSCNNLCPESGGKKIRELNIKKKRRKRVEYVIFGAPKKGKDIK